MNKDCPSCPAFGKHCPHRVNGAPYTYDCYLTVADLEKENAELKEFVNAPHTKGRKTTRADYIKTVWDLSKQLTKAKEIIKDLCGMVRELNNPNVQLTNIDYSLSEAEQFLNSEVEE